MLIAQISDTHIVLDAPDRDQRIADFEAVISDINALDPQPDVIVHTGDVVHTAHEEEYAISADILQKAKAPVFVMMGNKDDRTKMREAFGPQGYFNPRSQFIDYAVEDYPVRLLMLDTSSPATNKGEFCKERFENLMRMLEEDTGRPVAIFAHHPPIVVDVGPEPVHYEDPATMEQICNAIEPCEGRIKAMFCGHVHRSTTGRIGKVPVNVMSAVATPLRRGDYPGWMSGRPAYQLHRLDEMTGFFITETRICERVVSSPAHR